MGWRGFHAIASGREDRANLVNSELKPEDKQDALTNNVDPATIKADKVARKGLQLWRAFDHCMALAENLRADGELAEIQAAMRRQKVTDRHMDILRSRLLRNDGVDGTDKRLRLPPFSNNNIQYLSLIHI